MSGEPTIQASFSVTPDLKHHGQAMSSSLRVNWIQSQSLEMQGLWNCSVFQKISHTSLTPPDRVFSSRFHYKIKRKGENSTSTKYIWDHCLNSHSAIPFLKHTAPALGSHHSIPSCVVVIVRNIFENSFVSCGSLLAIALLLHIHILFTP